MDYAKYDSPLGGIILTADDIGLTGLAIEGSRFFRRDAGHEEKISPAIESAMAWLDIYFSGGVPDFVPTLNLTGTAFRLRVWNELLKIPYGATRTYGEMAAALGTSARAIGMAVGRNPVTIIVPCHRVIGGGGALTGYAAGVDKKFKLLEIEKNIFDDKGRVAHG